jgi:hypothetical protein
MPSKKGLAKLFRNMPWSRAPASPKAEPTISAASRRGSRKSQRMVWWMRSPWRSAAATSSDPVKATDPWVRESIVTTASPVNSSPVATNTRCRWPIALSNLEKVVVVIIAVANQGSETYTPQKAGNADLRRFCILHFEFRVAILIAHIGGLSLSRFRLGSNA